MKVLREANMVLHANDSALNDPWIKSSDFLFDSQLHYLLVNWNHGYEWTISVGHVTDDAAHRFLSTDSRDQII